jgi:hypothetical protein
MQQIFIGSGEHAFPQGETKEFSVKKTQKRRGWNRA